MCGRETKDRILLHRQCEHKCEQLGYAAASLYAHETLHTTHFNASHFKDDTGDTPRTLLTPQPVVIRYTRVHPHATRHYL